MNKHFSYSLTLSKDTDLEFQVLLGTFTLKLKTRLFAERTWEMVNRFHKKKGGELVVCSYLFNLSFLEFGGKKDDNERQNHEHNGNQ